MEIISGIYKITNLNNSKSYIGQSKNIYLRWKQHTQSLPTEYPISLIQKAFNKYGLKQQVSRHGIYSGFEFEILEEVETEALLETETKWIKAESPEYNLTLTAPKNDLSQFTKKRKNRVFVQYHNYAREGHFPGLRLESEDPDMELMDDAQHYISTRKRSEAASSKGDLVILILGIRYKGKMNYFLWTKTFVEEITFIPEGTDLPYNVIGTQKHYNYPFRLNDEEGFSQFQRKCGNFAYGFQSITEENPFKSRLLEIASSNYLDNEELTHEEYYNLFMERYFPEGLG